MISMFSLFSYMNKKIVLKNCKQTNLFFKAPFGMEKWKEIKFEKNKNRFKYNKLILYVYSNSFYLFISAIYKDKEIQKYVKF